MAADYITEHLEAQGRQSVHEQNMREAAIYMLKGMKEKAALDHVEQIQWERENAIAQQHVVEDENGNFHGYIETREPLKTHFSQQKPNTKHSHE